MVHLLSAGIAHDIKNPLQGIVAAGEILQMSLRGKGTLLEVEKRRILDVLREAGGNKSAAARRLGITRRRLYSRMEILGLEVENDGKD